MGGWTELKMRLVERGVLNEFFLGSDATPEQDASADFTIPDDAYFPLLIDTHLREASSHLDRVLSYRREMRELEILAVRAAADYALQQEQASANLDLALIRLRAAQARTERNAQDNAVKAFQTGSSDVAGFGELASGASVRLGQDLADAEREAQLLKDIHQRDSDYQDLYAARHNEPGNAHNYAERAGILLNLLQQDLVFARKKCQALNEGFSLVYGRDPKCGFRDDFTIDDLVMWLRYLFEDIAIEDQLESEFDIVLPLAQNIGAKSSVLDADAWKNAMRDLGAKKKFDLAFNLKEEHLLGRKRIRIRRVGVSYGTDVFVEPSGIDRAATWESYCRYRGELTPPPQAASLAKYKRPPISFGAISVFGAPLDFAEGSEVANLNPVGRWQIAIEPHPTTKNTEMRDMITGADGSTPWVDLKLHLRVRASGAA